MMDWNWFGFSLLYLFIIVVIHELGHYLGYVIFGIIPKLNIHWWGASCGSKEQAQELTVSQKMWVIWLGIWIGYIPIIAFGLVGYEWALFYFALCAGDALMLYALYTFDKKWMNYKLKYFSFITKYQGKVVRVE